MHDIEENHHKGLHQSAAAAGLSKECTAREAIIEFILVEVEAAFFFYINILYINISLSSSPFNGIGCINLSMFFVVPWTHRVQHKKAQVHDLWILIDVHMYTLKPIKA